MAMNVRRGNDPFKKYWWLILVVFGFVGLWVCAPAMDASTGGGAARREGGLNSGEQSLDAVTNPAGAPGSVVDLSMGSYKRKNRGEITSSLYQSAEPEKAAPGKPVHGSASPSGSTLASALKRAAKKDSSGWGGKKARRGFKSPKGSFGGLSGLGGSGGGSSSASAGGGGTGAFGTRNANVGITQTRGLGSIGAGAGGKSGPEFMRSLKRMSRTQTKIASLRSMDAASAGGQTSFDGTTNAKSSIGGGGSRGGGGVYGKLDEGSAPRNLKPSTEGAGQEYKITPPEAPEGEEKEDDEDMRKMIIKMILQALIGGMVGALVGSVFEAGDKKKTSLLDPKDFEKYAMHRRRYGPGTLSVA